MLFTCSLPTFIFDDRGAQRSFHVFMLETQFREIWKSILVRVCDVNSNVGFDFENNTHTNAVWRVHFTVVLLFLRKWMWSILSRRRDEEERVQLNPFTGKTVVENCAPIFHVALSRWLVPTVDRENALCFLWHLLKNGRFASECSIQNNPLYVSYFWNESY